MPKCPNCKTDQAVRPSQKKKLLLEPPRLFGLRPFRCDNCNSRFYRFSSLDRQPMASRNSSSPPQLL